MNTDGDKNFGLIDEMGVSVGNTGVLPSATETGDGGAAPYVVIKSTNPRIIAKEDGIIKIFHEGGSSIVMDKSGNIQITCDGTLTIGKDGTSTGVSVAGAIGPNSFVRGEEMVAVFNQLLTALSSMAGTLSSGGMCPYPSGPNPALATAMSALQTQLNGTMGTGKTYDMADSLSKIIKGE